MADNSKIEWTDATWNPIRGCSRVSEGCRNCYAERVAARFSGEGQAYEGLAVMKEAGPRWTGTVRLVDKHLADPLRWKKPRRIFVNSMSDLFHEGLPDEAIERVFAIMALCPQHTFQVLTKRPERMRRWFCDPIPLSDRSAFVLAQAAHAGRIVWDSRGSERHNYGPGRMGDISNRRVPPKWPLPNVWLGVSVENQKAADERVPLLLETPAAVRFLSCEPLLGPVKIPPGLDLVIAGGESGHGARPMNQKWVRSLRGQCQVAGVPFFFKQWGEWLPMGQQDRSVEFPSVVADGANGCPAGGYPESRVFRWPDGLESYRAGKSNAGRLLDGRTWDELPGVING